MEQTTKSHVTEGNYFNILTLKFFCKIFKNLKYTSQSFLHLIAKYHVHISVAILTMLYCNDLFTFFSRLNCEILENHDCLEFIFNFDLLNENSWHLTFMLTSACISNIAKVQERHSQPANTLLMACVHTHTFAELLSNYIYHQNFALVYIYQAI